MIPDDVADVLGALPVGVFLTDPEGAMTMATPLAMEIAGLGPDDWSGRNVIELVAPEDVVEVLGHLSSGRQIGAGGLGGPHTFRVTGADGRLRQLEVWARNRCEDGVIDGFAVVVTHEATNRLLLDVVQGVAEGDPVETVLAGVVRALAGLPVEAEAMVVPADGATVSSPGAGEHAGPAARAMARRVLDGGPAEEHTDLDGGGPAWCLPVHDGRGRPWAALVVWPLTTVEPTLNQRMHLDRALAVLRLAVTRDEALAELRRAATHDPLTGVLNRTALHEGWSARPTDVTLLCVDLDGFKAVNDTRGHVVGDSVLVTVARRLQRAVRPSDEVVRLGGDEFAVICTDVGDDEARDLALRLVEAVARPIAVGDGSTVAIRASVGLARTGAVVTDPTVLLDAADTALYRAKRAGGGRVEAA